MVHPERGVPPHPERGSTSAPSGTVPLSRAGAATPDPGDARGSLRAMRMVRSELCERFVPSDARGSFRAMREVRSERCERLVPSDARGSFRAMRKARSERCERFVPSYARGSFRAIREVRSERCERFVPSDAKGSSRVEGSIPFICRERVAAIRAVLAHFQICEPKAAYKRVCRKADSS